MIPRHERLALLCAATGRSKEFWLAHPEVPLLPGEAALLDRWMAMRSNGLPLAYLIGWREFYGRRFWVSPETLIPRPDTELLIDTAKAISQRFRSAESIRLADLGTGSGCIAISLALEIAGCTVAASDISMNALSVARNNAAWLGASGSVSFTQGSWWHAFESLPYKLHGIVSNPPYIAGQDPHLAQGDLRHEPAAALTPSATGVACDGLQAIKTIARNATEHLVSGGFLLIEHGFDQQADVIGIFQEAGLSEIQALPDLSGNPRAVVGFHAQASNPL